MLTGGAGYDLVDGGTGNDIAAHIAMTAAEYAAATPAAGEELKNPLDAFFDTAIGGTGSDTLRIYISTADFQGATLRGEILAYVDNLALFNDASGALATIGGLRLKAGGFERVELFVDYVGTSIAGGGGGKGPALFTALTDWVDFDVVRKGQYGEGSQYDALGGNDSVFLASSAEKAAAAGFDPTRRFFAGDGDDRVYGRGLADIVDGGNGNDLLHGGAGDDTIDGGAGADMIDGGAGDDTMNGGTGNDVAVVSGSGDVVDGGAGYDRAQASESADTLAFTAANLIAVERIDLLGGNDVLTLDGTTVQHVFAGDGNDTVSGAGGAETFWSNGGNDVVDGRGGNDTLYGEAGADTLTGGDGNDLIDGGGDNDLLSGGEGDDLIYGQVGNDSAAGGAGNDLVVGGAGNDTLDGGDGNDTILGQDGADSANGGEGDDVIDGGEMADRLSGGAGNDVLQGGGGDDTIAGDAGDDVVFGGAGHDRINGGDDADVIFGETGNDTVSGGGGDDILSGGGGTDTVDGGTGDDILLFEADRVFTRIVIGGVAHDLFALNVDGDFTKDVSIRLTSSAAGFATSYKGSLDCFVGGTGVDTLLGTGDHDVVALYMVSTTGGCLKDLVAGIEIFSMGAGDDIVALGGTSGGMPGTSESVVVYGEAGRDALWSARGNDTLDGGAGSDWLSGGAGDDRLWGGDETGFGAGGEDHWTAADFDTRKFNDILDGGAGNDSVDGGAGQDLLALGLGDDTLWGGAGADLFVAEGTWGKDRIMDFDLGGGDRIAAIGFDKAAVAAVESADGLSLILDDQSSILLAGFALPANVAAADLFI
jgi:Ca2+-binding RTX toxin-like protein